MKRNKKDANRALRNGRLAIKQLGFQQNSLNTLELNWMSSILGQYLKYPSQEQAYTHRQANRLGQFDLKSDQKIREQQELLAKIQNDQLNQEKNQNTPIVIYHSQAARESNPQPKQKTNQNQQDQKLKQIKNIDRCRCCNKPKQQSIKFFTQIDVINRLGLSTVLYFKTINYLGFLLMIMFLVFGLFAVITNFVSSRIYKSQLIQQNIDPIKTEMTYQSFLQIALGSKELSTSNFSNVTFQIQCWLGVITMAIMLWRYMKTKRSIKKYEFFVDYKTSSAADFALQFSEIPIQYYDEFSKQLLQNLLNNQRIKIRNDVQNYEKLDQKFKEMLQMQISIFSIHKMSRYEIQKHYFDYNDQRIKKNDKEVEEIYKQWIKIIQKKNKNEMEKLDIKQLENLEKYYKQKKKQKKKLIQQQQQNRKIKADRQVKNTHKDFSAFVTFNHTLNKELVQRLHSKQNSLLHNLPCLKKRNYIQLPNKRDSSRHHEIIIETAPQPEDILWSNFVYGRFERWSRVFLTFMATMIILSVSFFLVYLLTIVQVTISNEQASTKSLASTLISIAISGVLFGINIIIEIIINKLTKLERHTSYTREQTSIAVKCIIAQLINMILIPIAINKIIKNNLFGVDGLADDVFYQGITFAVLNPLQKIINVGVIKTLAMIFWYHNPWQRIKLSQRQLNKTYQLEQFEIGIQYVSVISFYLFACFYAALQPAVLAIVGLGLFVYYYAQRFCLYIFSKKPTPGNEQISNIMWYFICCGPLLFAFGNFCWTDILAQRNQGRIANSITLVLAIVILLFPYDLYINKKHAQQIRKAYYFQDRFVITSDYDRSDPLTKQQALKQYQKDKIRNRKIKLKIKKDYQQYRKKLQDQLNYGDIYQQQDDDDQQQYYSQDQQPYFQVYINIDKLQEQLEQLQIWQNLKQKDPKIRDITYYTYQGYYENEKIQIIPVNFDDQEEQDQDRNVEYNYDNNEQEGDIYNKQIEQQKQRLQSIRIVQPTVVFPGAERNYPNYQNNVVYGANNIVQNARGSSGVYQVSQNNIIYGTNNVVPNASVPGVVYPVQQGNFPGPQNNGFYGPNNMGANTRGPYR